MNTGRHFNPPTPAYRPQDPFSSFNPRSAEKVPSCEITTPLPAKPKPVRIDPTEPNEEIVFKADPPWKNSFPKEMLSPKLTFQTLPTGKAIPKSAKPSLPQKAHPSFRKPTVSTPPKILVEEKVLPPVPLKKVAKAAPQEAVLKDGEEVRRCEWVRCTKTFITKVRGRTMIRRFCSATCRGRASEARTGKR